MNLNKRMIKKISENGATKSLTNLKVLLPIDLENLKG